MTANQINYAKLVEDRRSNQEQEKIGHRNASAAASQATTAARRQAEDARHNAESERINWWSAQEIQRHNLAGENLNTAAHYENVRSHKENENLGWFTARDQSNFRLVQGEALQRQADASMLNAYTKQGELANSRNALAESIRHNVVSEYEIERRNRAQEQISQQVANESKRHNLVSETTQQLAQRETARSNFAKETETNRANLAKETETIRSNTTREAETERSDRVRENIQIAGTINDYLNTAIRAFSAVTSGNKGLDNLARSIIMGMY